MYIPAGATLKLSEIMKAGSIKLQFYILVLTLINI